MKKAGRNIVLDRIKAVACIFIILIHCKFPGLSGDLFEAVARFGVPLFFAVSGKFLLSEKDISVKEIRASMLRKIRSILKVLGAVWIFYTIYSFWYSQTKDYTPRMWFSEKFNTFEFSRLILFNSGKFIYDFSYAFDHIWFILALLYVYILVFIFAKFVRRWAFPLFVLLTALLYVLELLQTYYPIRPFDISVSTWYVVRNWLFVGVPFTMLGFWYEEKIRQGKFIGNIKAAWLFILIGLLSTFIEYSIFGSKEVYLGSLVMVVGALILSQNPKAEISKSENDFMAFVGKELSSYIYYLHVFVISLFGWFIDRINPELYANVLFMYIRPLIVIAVTICISLLLYLANCNKMVRKAA